MGASRIEIQPSGERTLIDFFHRMADELGETTRHVLNGMVRSLSERGWVEPVSNLVEVFAEKGENADDVRRAIEDLHYRRLIDLDPSGKQIVGVLASISIPPTAHRAHLDAGADINTYGGMDLLGLNALFGRAVDAFTRCGHCGGEITLRTDEQAVVGATPTGVAGFQASWDGRAELAEVGARSPLFCGDGCLEAWSDSEGTPEGLPLSGDLLLHVGMMMANEAAEARFRLVAVED